MRFKALYDNNNSFWQQKSEWDFFLSCEDFAQFKEKADALKAASEPKRWETRPSGTNDSAEESPVLQTVSAAFGPEYAILTSMPVPKRIEHINIAASQLDSFIQKKPKNEIKAAITQALVDTTRDAALINHAILRDAMQMADDEAKKYTQDLVDSTNKLVKSSSHLISPDIFNDEMMSSLVTKSNGTVIQHMTRVFLNGVAFLLYYNDLVSTSSVINKLRVSFDSEFRAFYYTLLPHLGEEKLNLERVFLGGMRAIPENILFNWATGFLLHDVGKAPAVEYHEGESAYNRGIVVEHVKVGYAQVMNKTNYPKEAALITGYHHEYYGDPDGYGYFRAYLENYKKANPKARQNYCIAYDIEAMLDYEALAYFPAKVLEIVDVYDSLTDPNRKYKSALPLEEALALMKSEFIEKKRKIDIILFDIFCGFVRERKNSQKSARK
jgi:hypothetical protein